MLLSLLSIYNVPNRQIGKLNGNITSFSVLLTMCILSIRNVRTIYSILYVYNKKTGRSAMRWVKISQIFNQPETRGIDECQFCIERGKGASHSTRFFSALTTVLMLNTAIYGHFIITQCTRKK